jgi:glycosyltransferase involved in cell wall biosynthesis
LSGPIVINARAAIRREISGVERWAREMVERLPALRPDAYLVAAPRPRLAHRPGHAWEQCVLPVRAARAGARVIFSPANVAPLAWPRNIVVLHDAVLLSHPEWFSLPYRAWHGPLLHGLARTAHRVIVPSRFSALELSEHTGVGLDRIDIVPGGVDERFTPAADPEPARRALGLERPYVLTVGGAGLRKNLRVLEPLAAELHARGIDVAAAGSRRSHHAHSDDLGGIVGLGYVPEELLPSLYAGARAFVLPSLHEGFGLPCIEAMRSGVPVAASDRGAVPETCGGAARLFDPTDPAAVTAAVLSIVEDDAEHSRLRTAGLSRAAGLTWERAADAVDGILVGALSG